MEQTPKDVQVAYFNMMAEAEPLLNAALEVANNSDPTTYDGMRYRSSCHFCRCDVPYHEKDCEWITFQIAAARFGELKSEFEQKVYEHDLYWELLAPRERRSA